MKFRVGCLVVLAVACALAFGADIYSIRIGAEPQLISHSWNKGFVAGAIIAAEQSGATADTLCAGFNQRLQTFDYSLEVYTTMSQTKIRELTAALQDGAFTTAGINCVLNWKADPDI